MGASQFSDNFQYFDNPDIRTYSRFFKHLSQFSYSTTHYSVISSFLGPNKRVCINRGSVWKIFTALIESNKFLIQDEDVCIIRCPLLIFQNMHFQNPICSLVEETLYAHHNVYGCSTLSLLGMWYFWNEEFRLAIGDGCQIQDIIKNSQNILEQVISAVSDTTVKFDTMIFKKQNLARKDDKTQKISDCIPVPIRYSSRHFSPALNFSSLEDDCLFDRCFELDERCLKTVVDCLNHDENAEISNLIFECWKRQTCSSNYSKFSPDDIHICPIVLPCSSSTIIDGFIIKSYLNFSSCHDMKNICSNRSLLIKGSITYEYVHLGFSPKVKITVQQMSSATTKDIWIKKICEHIKQLNLNVLFIKDDIDPEVATFCLVHSVLVLSHIPLPLFKKICGALQCSPCTYILDCNEKDIIMNIDVKMWKPQEDQADILLKDQYFSINIDSKSMVKLQTIVLCHPSQVLLESMKHQTHHLISRLSMSFESNTLLPGGGRSEEWCSRFLTEIPQFHELSDPTSRIVKALASGFKSYSDTVSQKKALSDNEELEIMDEMSSKLNAWRSALSLLLLTLQCDSVIINGIDDLYIKKICTNIL